MSHLATRACVGAGRRAVQSNFCKDSAPGQQTGIQRIKGSLTTPTRREAQRGCAPRAVEVYACAWQCQTASSWVRNRSWILFFGFPKVNEYGWSSGERGDACLAYACGTTSSAIRDEHIHRIYRSNRATQQRNGRSRLRSRHVMYYSASESVMVKNI